MAAPIDQHSHQEGKDYNYIDRSYALQEDISGQSPQVEICNVGSLPFNDFCYSAISKAI